MGPSPLVLAHHSTLFSLSFFPGLPSECERILSRSDGDCSVPTDGQLVPLPTARLPQGPGVSLVGHLTCGLVQSSLPPHPAALD